MRLPIQEVFPEARQAMLALERTVHKSTLEPALLDLVRVRASQLNGCGHCIDMHTKDARARGESEQRLYRRPAIARESAPRWTGPSRSPFFRRRAPPTTSTSACAR